MWHAPEVLLATTALPSFSLSKVFSYSAHWIRSSKSSYSHQAWQATHRVWALQNFHTHTRRFTTSHLRLARGTSIISLRRTPSVLRALRRCVRQNNSHWAAHATLALSCVRGAFARRAYFTTLSINCLSKWCAQVQYQLEKLERLERLENGHHIDHQIYIAQLHGGHTLPRLAADGVHRP